jgi:hypothetical protein
MTSPLRLATGLAALLALAGCYNAAEPYRALVADNVTTTGQVSHVACNDHGAVYYAFNAGGREYRARAPAGVPTCETAKPGDPVVVYYRPSDPATNTLLHPAKAYDQERGWTVSSGASIAIGCVWIIVLSLATSLWPRRPSRPPRA